MISEAEFANLVHHFPALRELESGHRRLLCDVSQAVRVQRGSVLFDVGSACESFLLLTEGHVRVVAQAGGDREILLYRVKPGQLCVLTLSCALGHEEYPARGTVTEASHAVAVPVQHFEELVSRSATLRRMVFGSLSQRVRGLMGLVEEVAFRRLDERLAEYLLQESPEGGEEVLSTTHQEIADALGTSREIVSRMLANLADDGVVALGRRRIEILDRERLRGNVRST